MEATTTQLVLKTESSAAGQPGCASAYFVKINAHRALGLNSANATSGRAHNNVMWHLCASDAGEGQEPQQLQRDTSRYVVSQSSAAVGELPQSLFSLLLTSIQQMQNRVDARFDQLERRMSNMERMLNSLQKQQAIVAKKRKRCPTAMPLNEPKQFLDSPCPFNGNSSSSSSNSNSTNSNNNNSNVSMVCAGGGAVVHATVPSSTSISSEATFISSCSSKTLSEFMKSAQMDSIPSLKGHCVATDSGYILSNVVDDSGTVYSFKFPLSLIEKILKDNPPEPSGWSASKALVTLLDHIYHPLEMAMRRLPALPASSSLSSNLQGRQRSELFVGTQYEDGIAFSADRLLPCCKLIEHYYPGWRYKAFERNHAFREIVHKKCRTRRRDLKQYLQQCGKTKEQVLDMIIKGIDLPPRDFLLK